MTDWYMAGMHAISNGEYLIDWGWSSWCTVYKNGREVAKFHDEEAAKRYCEGDKSHQHYETINFVASFMGRS